ncbi:hypothetical protein BRC65_04220 [Halobacteriales archaeon QH_2_65_14]|nr:MAG: hypothetical protein BRC65_04220 [Halobacteriales archaeon QH_2_65_14]
MVVTESSFGVLLLTVVVLAYVVISAVPRVDEKSDGYQKFYALSTLGVAYLVLLMMLLFLGDQLADVEPVEQVLWLAALSYLLFGLTMLYDVFDDWLRLFADPEYNTLVEAAMVAALVVALVVYLLLVP